MKRVVTIGIIVICLFLVSLSLVATAYRIQDCTSGRILGQDSDGDELEDDEEDIIGSDPCDPCIPDCDCDACLNLPPIGNKKAKLIISKLYTSKTRYHLGEKVTANYNIANEGTIDAAIYQVMHEIIDPNGRTICTYTSRKYSILAGRTQNLQSVNLIPSRAKSGTYTVKATLISGSGGSTKTTTFSVQPPQQCKVTFRCLPYEERSSGFRYIDTGEYIMCWASFPNPNNEVVSGWTTVNGDVHEHYSSFQGDTVPIEWESFIPGDYKIESEFRFKNGAVCTGHTWVRVGLPLLGPFIFRWAPIIVLALLLIVGGFTRRELLLIMPGAIIIFFLVLIYLGVI